jgi:hypothetical protein
MMSIGLCVFVLGVIALGLGIGFWLQGKLAASGQLIKLPSPFDEGK